jgi:NADH dehydrogenase
LGLFNEENLFACGRDFRLTTIITLLERLPVYPMFDRGLTRLQPAHVEDVAEAMTRVLEQPGKHPITFEFGGPRVYSYEELLKIVAHEASLKPKLIPIPFAAWHVLAWFAECVRTRPSPGAKWN